MNKMISIFLLKKCYHHRTYGSSGASVSLSLTSAIPGFNFLYFLWYMCVCMCNNMIVTIKLAVWILNAFVRNTKNDQLSHMTLCLVGDLISLQRKKKVITNADDKRFNSNTSLWTSKVVVHLLRLILMV